MRASQLLQPAATLPARASIDTAAKHLGAGRAVVFIEEGDWRYVRPPDLVAYPATRQLRDLPHRLLPMVQLEEKLEPHTLGLHDLLGVTSDGQLVGAIDCTEATKALAGVTAGNADRLLGIAIRDRLMPRLLHDLANAMLVIGEYGNPDAAPSPAELLTQATQHAKALLNQARWLYVDAPQADHRLDADEFDAAEVVKTMEPLLKVAVRPASLHIDACQRASIKGAPWRAERILLNLALNASEAPDVTSIVVSLRADEQVVRFTVEDDGRGFAQSSDAPLPLRGQGMAIVARQAALLGGEIAVGSSSFGGARVDAIFPRQG